MGQFQKYFVHYAVIGSVERAHAHAYCAICSYCRPVAKALFTIRRPFFDAFYGRTIGGLFARGAIGQGLGRAGIGTFGANITKFANAVAPRFAMGKRHIRENL